MKEKQTNESFTMMTTDTKEVATQIKNKELVKERRRQIVDAAVPLTLLGHVDAYRRDTSGEKGCS